MQDTQTATRQFRVSLTYLWAWAASAHLLFVLACVTGVYLLGRDVDRVALICFGILPLAYWVVYGLKFRLMVSPCGLGWVNRSGVPCDLSWPDIERAERRNQFGLPVLALWSATQGGPFTFPICLADWDGAQESIRMAAGATHPVVLALAD